LGITRQDGSTWGLMLARDPKTNSPIYRAYDDEDLATKVYSGDPSYNNLPPSKEVSMRQDSWEAGFGQEFYDPNNPKKYFSSFNCDLRFKGMAIAGPLVSSLTLPMSNISPTFANKDMELAATGWTNGARAGGSPHSGTYFWANTIGTTSYQDASNWDNAWRSKVVIVGGWLYHPSTGSGSYANVKLSVDDGVDTTTSTGLSASDTWEWKMVSHTINAAGTRLRINLQVAAVTDGYFDDVSVSTATAGSAKGVDFNSVHYVPIWNVLCKVSSDGASLSAVGVFPSAITALEKMQASGTDYLFIALGTSQDYWCMTTAEAFTQSTAAVKRFEFFKVNNGATPNLWGNDTGNTIRYTPNPLNGGTAWSTATPVDMAANAITSLLSEANTLYIGKTDRPYYLDSTPAVQVLTEDTVALTASTSGKNFFAWKGDLFYPCGSQGLWWYDSSAGAAQFISPSLYVTNQFVGRVQALAADDQYLYASVLQNTSSDAILIMAGRQETVDGTTSWLWHPITYVAVAGSAAMWVTNTPKKRLYYFTPVEDASDSLDYIPLFSRYGLITPVSNYSFSTGGSNAYFETPWLHAGFKADTKAFIKLTCKLGHAYDADIYWTAAYRLLEDTAYTTIGSFKGTSSSRIETIYVPVDSGSNKPKSTMMRLKFGPVTDDTSKSPVLLDYDVRGIVYFPRRRMIECTVLASDDLLNLQGMQERGGAGTTKTVIEEARNATWPVTFYDLNNGTAIYVKFLNIQEVPIVDEKNRVTERAYQLLLQEVALS